MTDCVHLRRARFAREERQNASPAAEVDDDVVWLDQPVDGFAIEVRARLVEKKAAVIVDQCSRPLRQIGQGMANLHAKLIV